MASIVKYAVTDSAERGEGGLEMLPAGRGYQDSPLQPMRSGTGLWRVCAAEAVGAALLLMLTCLPACRAAPPLQHALAAGFTVATLVQCFDHVSGAQLNPTVTLAAALARRVTAAHAAAMCAAQLVGAVLGIATLSLLSPGSAQLCVTLPASDITNYQAFAIEMVAGGCLALANLSAWDARNRRLLDSWPLRVGTTVAALSLAAGEFTGASMNPVRSIAPALMSGNWNSHWVYWAGPLSGSALAAAVYALAWQVPPDTPARGTTQPPRSMRTDGDKTTTT